jgi:hypothetical protein
MKKLLRFILMTLLILQSCSGDNRSETNNDDTSLLIRRWYFVSSTSQGKTNYAETCPNNGNRDYLDFLSSNTANFYYIKSKTNNICSDEFALESYRWTKSGKIIKLSFINGVEVSSMVISELSATTLKFVETNSISGESALYEYKSY